MSIKILLKLVNKQAALTDTAVEAMECAVRCTQVTSFSGSGTGIAWHRIVLHGIALYLMVSHSFHVDRMVLHGIVLYLTVLHGIAWYCIVGFGARAVSRKTAIYFITSTPEVA